MTSATPDFEDPQHDIDLEVNDDDNLDVDTPSDELDEPETGKAEEGSTPKAAKTTTPRAKAPEGYVKPVEFARLLSEHLKKTVPPQVVYSYVKNNSGETAKNPFPVHTVEGDDYPWYIVPEEGFAWWDEKNSRVATSKAARADKAAAKAAKAAEAPATADSSEAVTEAE